ncbi:MAG: phosphoglycerate kinase [Thermoplasmata archaeon]|nr:MAG: phosphoglycerate kinase [Thermoplasmata archaeon]
MLGEVLTLDDIDLRGRTVIVRVDINSPVNPTDGSFLDITRFRSSLPTLRELAASKLVVLAHQSRPGKADYMTMREHARVLGRLLNRPVKYVDDLIGSRAQREIRTMEVGEVLVMENTRMYAEEVALKGKSIQELGRTHMVRNLANATDAFVTDAFAAAHRAQPSLVGFAERLPCIAGRLFAQEIDGVSRALGEGERPVLVVLGGAKADDSVRVAGHVLETGGADRVLTGGVVANVFLAASGVDIGEVNMQVVEREVGDSTKLLNDAKAVLEDHGDNIMMPIDVAQKTSKGGRVRARIEEMDPELPILDLGVDSVVAYIRAIKEAKTVVCNGPMGMFEEDAFAFGTKEVFTEIGRVSGYTLLGGGHTGVLSRSLGLDQVASHISTGGGALITYLSGGQMPVIESLKLSRVMYEKGEFALKPEQ